MMVDLGTTGNEDRCRYDIKRQSTAIQQYDIEKQSGIRYDIDKRNEYDFDI